MKNRDRSFSFFVLGFLFFLNILAWVAVYDLSKPRFLEVNFFDVGQGDAIFIVSPKNHQILIDGGPDSTILEKLAKEMPFWDRSIDLIILTHPESDHLSGLIEVLKRYKVENILWTGVVRDTFEFKEWLNSIQNEKAKVKIAQTGQRIKIHGSDPCSLQGLDPCVFMEILFPLENLEGQEVKNSNNTSIIAKLVYGQNPFLFTGDVSKSVEKKLIREYSCSNSCKFAILDSDVLKVGHHGSKTSSADEFIEEVSPEIAVISAGKNNRYGHPHQEVLETLAKYDIKILRTDLDGDIKIVSNGINLLIK